VIHDFKCAILRTAGRRGVALVIGSAKEVFLPHIAFASGKRRWTAIRPPGLKLAFVISALEEILGDAPSSATKTLGVKMEANPSISANASYGTVVEALVQFCLLKN
jgi:hypothetical protein